MKILIVSEFYWPNLDGAALFEHRLAQALRKRGHQIRAWAPAAGWRSYRENDRGITTYREASMPLAGKPHYRVSVWPFRHAWAIVRQERPDVIHIHNCTQIGLAALLAARRYKVAVVATNHAMPHNVLGRGIPVWLRAILSWLIWRFIVWFHNRADYVTTPTPIALSYLQHRGLRRPAAAVTNGLDTDYFQPGRRLVSGPPRLLYIGRLDYEKNLLVLLQALAQLPAELEVSLDIVGVGGHAGPLQRSARRLGVDTKVRFRGAVSEADKLRLLQTTTAFVMPSPAELQSIATMEAMACGRPVVVANAGALPNLVQDGVNGYLFSHRDASALAEALTNLIRSPELQQRFGQAGRETIRHYHSAAICYQGYEEIYQEVTKTLF